MCGDFGKDRDMEIDNCLFRDYRAGGSNAAKRRKGPLEDPGDWLFNTMP